jgi:hypothetical protein
VTGCGYDIRKRQGVFCKLAGGALVDRGWARSASLIIDRATGAAVDQRHGLGPLVHGGPGQGGYAPV